MKITASLVRASVTFLLLVALCILVSCKHSATVTPRIVESPGASYDDGERNSGVLAFLDCGDNRCVLVTSRFRARYNDLIIRYGQRFVPPIEKDYGVLQIPVGTMFLKTETGPYLTGTNTFLFTKEAMQKSGEMHAWKASGL